MDRKLINPLIVTGIADAVRAKGKTTEPIKVADLPNAIMNLPEGGGVGEDTSALLDAVGVESREDTGMANGLAIALTDAPLESSWSGERTTADGMPIKDGIAFVEKLKGLTIKDGENLQSFAPKAVVSKGRNLWDESTNLKDQWINAQGGYISQATGAQTTEMIPCKAGDAFTIQADFNSLAQNNIVCLAFYDDAGTNKLRVVSSNKERCMVSGVAPSGATYVRGAHYHITPRTIQLERGSVATDYVPYIAPSRLDFDLTTIVDAQGNQLFPDGELRSAGSVCDEVDYANNVVTAPFDIINLGTLNWTSGQSTGKPYSKNIVNGYKRPKDNGSAANIVCAKYTTCAYNSIIDGGISYTATGNLYILDSALIGLSANEVKQALSGVYLIIERDTPRTTQFTPTKSFYPVQSNGTEEAITDTIVPFNGEIRYRVDTESLLTQSASLLRYSNEVTGAENTSLGDAVKTLTDSYK